MSDVDEKLIVKLGQRISEQNQPDDIGFARAQRHANADFTGSLGDRIPDYSGDSDGGERQSQQ